MPKTLTSRVDRSLNHPVILFNDVVEILDLPDPDIGVMVSVVADDRRRVVAVGLALSNPFMDAVVANWDAYVV